MYFSTRDSSTGPSSASSWSRNSTSSRWRRRRLSSSTKSSSRDMDTLRLAGVILEAYQNRKKASRPRTISPHRPVSAMMPDMFPPVDERLVEPEVTRDEIIGGRRVVALPAEVPHADQHGELNYVLWAHVAPGYVAALGLLTRFDQDSDFASDICVRREGVDPQTGTRHLEELAFMVDSEEKEQVVAEKVPRMRRRGVRRIFAVFVESRQVCEWSSEGQGSWKPLGLASSIEDPCLVKPLPVAVLLDREAADDAVIEALAAKGNLALRRLEDEARREKDRAALATTADEALQG